VILTDHVASVVGQRNSAVLPDLVDPSLPEVARTTLPLNSLAVEWSTESQVLCCYADNYSVLEHIYI